jgi:hypothetical protein
MNMSHRIGTMRMSSLRNSRSSASLSEVVCQTSLPSLNVVSCSTYSCSGLLASSFRVADIFH